ncbi:hypothetical protein ACJ72_08073 [Emergomyces africanus]|uniref:Uncharacterized protein n=1 Tax=Emergomyces africanus TaxID=1955775 RepID=A0A1B7NLQ4_9EURO|nr:hypothetical protein ACJ72_08073 [Emergomyces africanus]
MKLSTLVAVTSTFILSAFAKSNPVLNPIPMEHPNRYITRSHMVRYKLGVYRPEVENPTSPGAYASVGVKMALICYRLGDRCQSAIAYKRGGVWTGEAYSIRLHFPGDFMPYPNIEDMVAWTK